jgi:flavodoxin
MKTIMAILLAGIMIFALAGFSSTDQNSNNSLENESSEIADKSKSAANDTASVIGTSTITAGKTIVVYFSGSGNTKRVAEFVADETSAELFELIPSEPYTDEDLNWRDSGSRINKEHDNPDLQDIALTTIQIPDWESYDTVFVGYPIWWQEAAWPINNFIRENDFTGKQVIPFCTSTSSGFGESGSKLAEMAGTGTWLDGMRFSENGAESNIRGWVQSLNLEMSVSAPAPQNEDEKNDILILYFSANNVKASDVDAVTSATPVANGKSSVAQMADMITEQTGGEIIKIIPSESYPLVYEEVADQAKKERDEDARPAFENLGVDPTSFKTVFIGYPVWWYQMPMIMETLFDTYDFTGVTIVPFNTHEGSRDGGTYDMIRAREPGAIVLDGLAIRGSDVSATSKDDIQKWLDGLDLD